MSSVQSLLCVPDCCYSVCLALDLFCEPPLVCARLWIFSVDLLLYVPGCCYSAFLTLDLFCEPVPDCWYSVCLALDFFCAIPFVCA